jgi:hypothetical protein
MPKTTAQRTPTPPRRAKRSAPPLKFDQKLVLFQWMLSLFGKALPDGTLGLEALGHSMKLDELEGFFEDNTSRFYHHLKLLIDRPELPNDLLLQYDQNIVRHWRRITERRNQNEGRTLYPKYFQYLCLLFTEIYLDRYFADKDSLLQALNDYTEKFNFDKEVRDQVQLFATDDLNKLAFWSATGSGKTLLMHINMLQYQHYLERYNHHRTLDHTILLTPNEGLSSQHLKEFALSNMDAIPFSKEGRDLFAGHAIIVIDIHKLREESGEKTVAIDAFEGNNLVLVDEGHRGASSAEVGTWMTMRNRLCINGFSFEYSATFGQAMKASSDRGLEQKYLKCILFDYSYKYFFKDGYGKHYQILNLENDSDEVIRRRYLTACLLTFYQQQKLFADKQKDFAQYLIERPLWVFVGGSVTKKPTHRDVSDVVDILLFLARFVLNRSESVGFLTTFLSGHTGLLDGDRDLFEGAFTYVGQQRMNGDQLFDDILQLLFNATAPGLIHIENLKNTDGEIALRLEGCDPFGVINVGDPSSLCNLCTEHPEELAVMTADFSDSLFRELDKSSSRINILIGSRKFTEGWNSWRVATMGLMNIARAEGPQVIQLFGRGVRLKGKDFCLKRTSPNNAGTPPNIERLETLNIFGVRADYMRQFKEYLEEEGLPIDQQRIEFVLPVVKNLGSVKLKTIRVEDTYDFKKDRAKRPTLGAPTHHLQKFPVVVDWYPQIQALSSRKGVSNQVGARQEGWFREEHVAFMDLDRIYFDIERFKNEKAYSNLTLPRAAIADLLLQRNWYTLFIPPEELEFTSFDRVRRWEDIAMVLLRKYCDRYYKRMKAEAENGHLQYQELTEEDPNFEREYRLYIEASRQDIVAKLEELSAAMAAGQLKNAAFPTFHGISAFGFERHLYLPLVYVNSDLVEIKPVVLATEGERDFVLDLKDFWDNNRDFFQGKELYLLRNLSRGRGVGFFEDGGFYPDFILWLIVGGRQYVSFVDPKGIRNLEGMNDPKIQFYKTIKDLEADLGDANVVLNSFIVSSTRFAQVALWIENADKAELERCNVLFQTDDRYTYISRLLTKVLL